MTDFSIASKVEAPKIDPLAMVGKIQGVQQQGIAIQQGALQNKLLGQEVDAKVALGKAVTAATDPKTGKTDWNKALGLMSQDPKGAFGVPAAAKAAMEQGTAEQGFEQAQLKTSLAKFDAVRSAILPLIANAKGQPITPELVKDAVVNGLFNTGILSAEDAPMAGAVLQQLGQDPTQNLLVLHRAYAQAGDGAKAINDLLGTWSNVDTGGQITPVRTGVGGETQVGTSVGKTLTPEKMAELVEIKDPVTGEPKKVTYGSLVRDGKINADGVVTGFAPGKAEAAQAAGTASAKSAQDLMVAADKAPATKAALTNIRDALTNFTPGPKANWTYMLGALATQMGVASPKVTEGVAAQEEFNKLATQFINQQVGALGGTGTDSKLESAMKGTPNEFMSREGILGVTNLMLGLEDATLAKNGAWQKWLGAGNGPESYGKFQTEFNRLYNPRVFQSQYMTDKQRQTMLGNMSKADRERFQKDWTLAKKAGWIQ